MDLHRAIGDAAAHFGREELGARRLGGDVAVLVAQPRRVEHHRARGIDFGLAVGKHRLHQLELGDWLAELPALERVGKRVGKHPVGGADTDRGDMQPPLVEHLHRRLEADALDAADELRGRHAARFEDHVAGMRAALAHFLVDLAKREAGRATLDDKGGNAARSLVARIGPRHDREDPGFGRVGNITLGAIENVIVAVERRGGR